MRSRRRLLILLVPAAVLTTVMTACGGGSGSGTDQTSAVPTTTIGPGPQVTTAPTSAPTSAAAAASAPTALAPTTLVPTTAAPTTPSPTTLAPTTTRQLVTLPPGVTEADRLAAEAAAIGWWEEFFLQIDALPGFDPQAILRLTVPGRPAGPKMLAALEDDQKRRFSFEPGSIQQTVVIDTRFLTPDRVEIKTCVADDGFFVQEGTAVKELGGLGRSFYLTVLRRTSGDWRIEDWGSYQPSEDGQSCV